MTSLLLTKMRRNSLGYRSGSLVVPDDFAVFTGDMKLKHIPTLGTLNELKRNLWRKREGTSTLHSVKV